MIFIPVGVADLIKSANNWNQRRKLKHPHKPIHKIVIDNGSNKMKLRNVPRDEPIYIHSHGGSRMSEGVKHVIGHRHVRRMTPLDLALSLKSLGLKKNHKILKIWSCRSAGKGNNKKDIPEHTFPGQLLLEMNKLGYNNLVIYGYLGYVTIFGHGNSKGVHHSPGDIAAANKKRNIACLHRYKFYMTEEKTLKRVKSEGTPDHINNSSPIATLA